MTAAVPSQIVLPSDQETSGRTLGDLEIEFLTQSIRSGTLTSTKGTFVRRLEQGFATLLGSVTACAASSGTAAIHAAIAAIDPEPGDEIITTPITDMGALTPILYQSAVPVFADVDPSTLNLTAETIKPKISHRTRAIVVTHLFGNPCDMGPILALAQEHGLPVIEDCAQAFLASWNGRPVGTLGAIGCFSLQQGKHITCGEGGLVVSDSPQMARRMMLFINKAWGYGDPAPDHYFLALNSRMTELQGAVALAQLRSLETSAQIRTLRAGQLDERLAGIRGIRPFPVYPNCRNVYWRYCLLVDPDVIRGGAVGLAKKLATVGISSAPRYIQKPAFQCEVFRERRTFGRSGFPFTEARPEALDYDPKNFPGTFEGLDRTLVLPWNEKYTEAHVDFIANSIAGAIAEL